jgi:hypothetical protein
MKGFLWIREKNSDTRFGRALRFVLQPKLMKHTTPSVSECHEMVESYARKNPTQSLLIAAGVGLFAGFVIHALKAPPSTGFSDKVLSDLQRRLHRLGDRAGSLANDGSELVHDGIDRVRGFDRNLRSIGKRVRGLFS